MGSDFPSSFLGPIHVLSFCLLAPKHPQNGVEASVDILVYSLLRFNSSREQRALDCFIRALPAAPSALFLTRRWLGVGCVPVAVHAAE